MLLRGLDGYIGAGKWGCSENECMGWAGWALLSPLAVTQQRPRTVGATGLPTPLPPHPMNFVPWSHVGSPQSHPLFHVPDLTSLQSDQKEKREKKDWGKANKDKRGTRTVLALS